MKFECPVVKIDTVEKLPNSDTLSITKVFGEIPVIVKTGSLNTGDLAVYIPEEALIPMNKPQFKGVIKTDKEIHRVKAVRLRGTYSEGLLIPFNGVEGTDMSIPWGITHYEELEPLVKGPNGTRGLQTAKDIKWAPKYGVENFLRNRHLIPEGSLVEVTEKVHGSNGRFTYDNGLHVGSHNLWRKPLYVPNSGTTLSKALLAFKLFINKFIPLFNLTPVNDDVWWQVANDLDLEKKLRGYKKFVFYGEVYGKVQDLKYGVTGVKLRIFDIYNANSLEWESPHTVTTICQDLGLEKVPVLYKGIYTRETVDPLRTGQSILHSGTIREGIVIKLLDNKGKNTALKHVSENYKTRKAGTEFK